MISTLNLLYVVLAVAIVPIATLLCMVLWRVFKILGTVENISAMIDRGIMFISNMDNVPMKIIKKFTEKKEK
ncbi:hypothetical protein KGV55_03905 [Candidatus Gracilibacteria bacterium]|nr:hypothetical protein [Candidatus Gracilibacteria bacterium]